MLALLSLCLLGQSPRRVGLPCPGAGRKTQKQLGTWSIYLFENYGRWERLKLKDTVDYIPSAAHLVAETACVFVYRSKPIELEDYDTLEIEIWGEAENVYFSVEYPTPYDPEQGDRFTMSFFREALDFDRGDTAHFKIPVFKKTYLGMRVNTRWGPLTRSLHGVGPEPQPVQIVVAFSKSGGELWLSNLRLIKGKKEE